MTTGTVLPYFRDVTADEESFSERLTRLVQAKKADGVSAAAIARKAHVSKQQLGNLMSGSSFKPSVPTLDGLAYALNVDRDYLMWGKQPESDMTTLPQFLGWLNGTRDTMMANAEAVIKAEARRQADAEWEAVLALLDEETAHRVARIAS